MEHSSEPLLIGLTTWPDKNSAEAFASTCIEKKLAACVQLDTPCTSFYYWDDAVQKDTELRCMIKFLPEQQFELEALLNKTHPYDTPQWILLESSLVSKLYYEWVKSSLT